MGILKALANGATSVRRNIFSFHLEFRPPILPKFELFLAQNWRIFEIAKGEKLKKNASDVFSKKKSFQ